VFSFAPFRKLSVSFASLSFNKDRDVETMRTLTAVMFLLGALTLTMEAHARSATIECADPSQRIPTTLSLAVPVNGDFSPVRGHQLAWVDVIWLGERDTDRLREYVTVDWRDGSLSAVQVYDIVRPGRVDDDVARTALLDATDFSAGLVDLDLCLPWVATYGIAIAYYEKGYVDGRAELSAIVTTFRTEERPTYFAAFDRQGRWTSISFGPDSLYQTGQTSSRWLDMVEESTGTPPDPSLGGSMLIEAASLIDDPGLHFISPQDGLIAGRQFTITGPNPSLLASHWVTSVRHEGHELLDDDGVLRNLSSERSPLQVVLGEEAGAPSYLLHVLDGRLGIEVEDATCEPRQQSAYGRITGRATGPVVDDGLVRGLRFLDSGFSISDTGFAPVAEDGRFEVEGIPCGADREGIRLYSGLGDSVTLTFGDGGAPDAVAELCAIFGPEPINDRTCAPIALGDVAFLFDEDPEALTRGDTFSLWCRPDRGGVDSIDAFLAAATRLSPARWQAIRDFLRADEGTLEDTDGDGSVCNARELLARDTVISFLSVTTSPVVRFASP
jgi:hypothetical protein